jgi:hypothetical protein
VPHVPRHCGVGVESTAANEADVAALAHEFSERVSALLSRNTAILRDQNLRQDREVTIKHLNTDPTGFFDPKQCDEFVQVEESKRIRNILAQGVRDSLLWTYVIHNGHSLLIAAILISQSQTIDYPIWSDGIHRQTISRTSSGLAAFGSRFLDDTTKDLKGAKRQANTAPMTLPDLHESDEPDYVAFCEMSEKPSGFRESIQLQKRLSPK